MAQTKAQLIDYGTAVASSVPTNGPYLAAANTVAISTNGSGRLFVNSSGSVGIGTSSPGWPLHVVTGNSSAMRIECASTNTNPSLNGETGLLLKNTDTTVGNMVSISVRDGNNNPNTQINFINTDQAGSGAIGFTTRSGGSYAERVRIDPAGRVGIGTTAPGFPVDCAQGSALYAYRATSGAKEVKIGANDPEIVSVGAPLYLSAAVGQPLLLRPNSVEAARLDTSGRLLVGTSTARANFFNGSAIAPFLQIEGTGSARMLSVFSNNTDGGVLVLGRQGGSTPGGNTLVANNDEIGIISFQASDGTDPTECARIQALIDGAPGNNDTPGRLVFSTTADGASSPTERVRITNLGKVTIQNNQGTYDAGGTGPGLEIFAGLEVGRYSYHFGAYVTGGQVGPYIRSAQNSNWASPVNIAIFHSGGSSFWSSVLPGTDNTYSCGASGLRWTSIWAANGTIQTSDIRDKTDIQPIDNGIDFIKRLRPITYKWKIGGYEIERDEDGAPIPDENGNPKQHPVPGNRTHWGFASQEVKAATDEFGIDFGGWVLTDKDDPESQQALRYDQFIAPLTKALQEAIAKIETLEARLSALEAA